MIEVSQIETSIVLRGPSSSRLAGTRLLKSHLLLNEERRALDNAVSPPRSVGAGTDLVQEGQRTDNVFIVVDGWACRYMTTSAGGRQFPGLVLPGDIGNLDSLMFDRLDYGVRTLSDATVVALPRDRALALAALHPGIAGTFTWLALIENVMLSRSALSLGRRDARQRLAHLFSEVSARLAVQDGNQSGFEFPLTQEQIADAVGLTGVHVNRTMQQLRAEGVIVTRGRTMLIPDVARLRRIAGFDPRYLHMDAAADGGLS